VLLFNASRTQFAAYDRGLCSTRDHTKPVMSCHLDTSELVELLQQSAVEHLTKFRQLTAEELECVDVIGNAVTDFEALYAYKRGDYERCLQLSIHNVHKLLIADTTVVIFSHPEFILLMDDNIASLVALMLIVKRSSRDDFDHVGLTQLSLSLYVMSQCQMKLRQSLISLAQTLNHIKVARRKYFHRKFTVDQLLVKLTERKILSYLVILQLYVELFLFSLVTSAANTVTDLASYAGIYIVEQLLEVSEVSFLPCCLYKICMHVI